MNVSTELLAKLQARQERIRNMCIMAHVDHGKTTLSDHLIGSNGLIHPKLMGELRYLDSREDEQARGITMKSSSISLLYVPGAALRPEGPRSVSDGEKLGSGYLVNLIDSPGHVDFCSEVSTAARLSDGALVVVDAVEGVCIQTHAVLRQAWEEKVAPCLFINKMDRLILELQLTPAEAYARLQAIVTHANMIMSAFRSEAYMSEADAVLAHEAHAAEAAHAGGEGGGGDDNAGGDEGGAADDNGAAAGAEQDGEDVFVPAKCNVAFGSAHDGWAFTVDQFAGMYAEKLGCKPEALTRVLWGDYTFSPKDKRVVRLRRRGGDAKGAKPMFVQFVLEAIWRAYSACEPGADVAGVLGQIVKSRGLGGQVPARALEHPEPKQALRAVMRAWVPLSEAVLAMAVVHMPSPPAAAPTRVPRLLGGKPGEVPRELAAALPEDALVALRAAEAAVACSDSDPGAPLVVYVSKMVAVPFSSLPRQPGEPAPANATDEVFLAFGRVYSGVVHDGQLVHVLSAAYNPAQPASSQRQTAVIRGVYMMMGRTLERLPAVPAGCVLALGGLETAILKSATLSSTPAVRPLAPMTFQAAPIVRVAVEPTNPADLPRLVEGLRLLNRADPFVEVAVLDSGEHVLGAAGEVHLETCVKDLRERFARVDLQVSPPLVAFRETVGHPAEVGEGAAVGSRGPPRIVEASTANGVATVRVRAAPLPGALASCLDSHAATLKRLIHSAAAASSSSSAAASGAAAGSSSVAGAMAHTGSSGTAGHAGQQEASSLGIASGADSEEALRAQVESILSEGGAPLRSLLERGWLLGPKGCGPNLLLTRNAGAAAHGSPVRAASLFDAPHNIVVKAPKSGSQGMSAHSTQHAQPEPGASTDSGHAYADADGAATTTSLNHATDTVEVRLGAPLAAQALGVLPPGAAQEPPPALPPGLDQVAPLLESGVVAGFQLATAAGPLCEEPLWGVAFEVEVRVAAPGGGDGGALELQEEVYGPFSGQVMTAVAAACKRAVMEADPRLVEALYLCQVQASAEALSGTYAVLNRRRARVLSEEMREGSDVFVVHAYLPVEAAFGLADEMRRRSSGAASASLLLSHWERLQVDPFFVAVTEEEREEHGEEGGAGAPNLARRLVTAVRRRKGLPVEEKVVKAATKQRTLKRNV